MTNLIPLENEYLRLAVLPSMGGGLAYFDAKIAGVSWRPVFRTSPSNPSDPNQLAFYPLLPWSNRVTPEFVWRGDQYLLACNRKSELLPIHGDAWLSLWEVHELTDSSVTIRLVSNLCQPYDYEALLKYEITGQVLSVSVQVTHHGERPIPYGLGFHPWIRRTPDTILNASYKGRWIEDPHSQLPVHRVAAAEYESKDEPDTSDLPTGYINCIFDGWDSEAMVCWPDSGLSMTVRSDPVLEYFVLYSLGQESDFFCFEPVSHLINAHATDDPISNGLRELHKGDSLRASTIFQINRINTEKRSEQQL